MKLDNSFFEPGIVLYNEFNISFNVDFSEQINNLLEDLIQVKFGKYLIDIGWYPEFNCSGDLVVQLIFNDDWTIPVQKKHVNNEKELFDAIIRMKEIACRTDMINNRTSYITKKP